MMNVILALHLMVAIALIGMVLMQRSEGGALGMGGGSGSLMSGRGAANALARGTGILGAVFFITSISLTLLAGGARAPKSVVDAPASSPLAPIVEMFDRLTHPAPKPVAVPSPTPAPVLVIPAPVAPATGEFAPAPDSVVQRAAPLDAASVTPPAAPAKPVIAAAPAKPVIVASPPPAAAPAPAARSSVTPPAAPRPTVARAPVQVPPGAALTSVKPAESGEPQIPADRPRGRAGPDE